MIKAVIFDIGGVVLVSKHKKFHKYVLRTLEFALRRFRKVVGLPAQDSRLVIELYKKSLVMNEGVIKIIQDLKSNGLMTPVISNTSAEKMRLNKELDVYKHFNPHPLLLSAELGVKKPNREIYEIAVERIGLKPEECIFIDDKAENLIAAMDIGMKGILFKNAEQLKKDLERHGVKID